MVSIGAGGGGGDLHKSWKWKVGEGVYACVGNGKCPFHPLHYGDQSISVDDQIFYY